MNRSAIVIGLDVAEPRVIEERIEIAPDLSKISQEGTCSQFNNIVNCCSVPTKYLTTEPLWTLFSMVYRVNIFSY